MNKNRLWNRKGVMKRILSQSKSKLQKILPVDMTLFLLQFIRHPTDIGAIAPSSAQLAEAMTRYVVPDPNPAKGKVYLEAGAGTGAFTKTLIGKLGPLDRLDIIEINPKFCERLQKKYSGLKNVSIHTGSVLEWKPSYKYDAIISSLPFNAFRAQFVADIFEHYKKITKVGGFATYCEYIALPGIRKVFLSPNARQALQETLDVTANFEKIHQVRIDKVYVNIPPAAVHHCQFL